MELVVEKSMVKEALRELIIEEPSLFKTIFKEVLLENSPEDEKFETLIQKNFKRFDATFKALA